MIKEETRIQLEDEDNHWRSIQYSLLTEQTNFFPFDESSSIGRNVEDNNSFGANIVFSCSDRQTLYAHEFVLKRGTSFLNDVLNTTQANSYKDPFGKIVVLLPDISSEILKHCLEIIYLGETNLSSNAKPWDTFQEIFNIMDSTFKIKLSLDKIKKNSPATSNSAILGGVACRNVGIKNSYVEKSVKEKDELDMNLPIDPILDDRYSHLSIQSLESNITIDGILEDDTYNNSMTEHNYEANDEDFDTEENKKKTVKGFSCQDCEFKDKDRYMLKRHVREKHMKCGKCSYIATEKYNLNRHLKNVHKGADDTAVDHSTENDTDYSLNIEDSLESKKGQLKANVVRSAHHQALKKCLTEGGLAKDTVLKRANMFENFRIYCEKLKPNTTFDFIISNNLLLEEVLMSYMDTFRNNHKRTTIDSVRSHLKHSILNQTNGETDITVAYKFPQFALMYQSLMKDLEEKGKDVVVHQGPIDDDTLFKFYEFIGNVTQLVISRGTKKFEQYKSNIPWQYHQSYHYLLQGGVLLILSLWDVRPGSKDVTKLTKADFTKMYDSDSKTHYFLKHIEGGSGKLKKMKGRDKNAVASGIIPFIDISPQFNPGLTLETYINSLSSESELLFQRPKRRSNQFHLDSPLTETLFEPNPLGINLCLGMLPRISGIIGVQKVTNRTLRLTGILKRHGMENGTMMQLQRQKSIKALESLEWYNGKTSIKQKLEMAATFKVQNIEKAPVSENRKGGKTPSSKNTKTKNVPENNDMDDYAESVENLLNEEDIDEQLEDDDELAEDDHIENAEQLPIIDDSS